MPAKKGSKKTAKRKVEEVESDSDSSSAEVEATPQKKASPKKAVKKSPKASPKKSPKAAPKKAAKRKAEEEKEARKKSKKDESDSSDSQSKESASDEEEEKDPYHVDNFDICDATKQALLERGIKTLFPIQAATFKHIAEGKDIIGRARTGCGKTLAFALPIVETLLKINNTKRGRKPACLVLAPTRELAQQVGKEFTTVAPSLSILCIYGGSPMGPQCQALKAGVDVLVGTPGRVIDHLEKGTLVLTDIAHVVLDEADKMLEMGFKEDVDSILEKASTQHQKCLFSATLPAWVSEVAQKHMVDHQVIDMVTDSEGTASKDVRHIAIVTHWTSRVATISDCIGMYAGATGRVLVFCSTKAECNEMCSDENMKYEAKPLHGDIAQACRETTLEAFRNGRFRVLVATDVAARGLDMRVDLVINSKVPESRGGYPEVETYVHRSGRTGRAGRKGVCVTLYAANAKNSVKTIEKKTNNTFEWLAAPQPAQVMEIAAATAIQDAARIPEEVLEHFTKQATDLVQAMGDANKAVAAALALATGHTEKPKAKSLLSNAHGYVCHMFSSKWKEIDGLGYVWGALRKVLPDEVLNDPKAIQTMQFTADKWGAVFDAREDVAEILEATVKKDDWLSVPTELPELLEKSTKGGKGGKGKGKGRDSEGGKGGGKGKGGKGKGKGGKGGKGKGGKGGW
eukprot:TRINITY_DN766_c0_g1_i1.p1 TRINITY_DN766_c0_g1~~TRINITY_DN766_c0_g1_i1.p1  ORF type:complete len:685 (+),score=300.79 TRINITY_DN766_c0_g1_i1:69-2123(+)